MNNAASRSMQTPLYIPPLVSLRDPGSVASFVNRRITAAVCLRCNGTGLWTTLDSIAEWLEYLAMDRPWLAENWVHHADIDTMLENIHDLIDHRPAVSLHSEQVKSIYNAFLNLRFDAERRLANSGSEVNQ
jgi:hypothetical protein